MLRWSRRRGSRPAVCSFWKIENVFTRPGSLTEVVARGTPRKTISSTQLDQLARQGRSHRGYPYEDATCGNRIAFADGNSIGACRGDDQHDRNADADK